MATRLTGTRIARAGTGGTPPDYATVTAIVPTPDANFAYGLGYSSSTSPCLLLKFDLRADDTVTGIDLSSAAGDARVTGGMVATPDLSKVYVFAANGNVVEVNTSDDSFSLFGTLDIAAGITVAIDFQPSKLFWLSATQILACTSLRTPLLIDLDAMTLTKFGGLGRHGMMQVPDRPLNFFGFFSQGDHIRASPLLVMSLEEGLWLNAIGFNMGFAEGGTNWPPANYPATTSIDACYPGHSGVAGFAFDPDGRLYMVSPVGELILMDLEARTVSKIAAGLEWTTDFSSQAAFHPARNALLVCRGAVMAAYT